MVIILAGCFEQFEQYGDYPVGWDSGGYSRILGLVVTGL
jgi:hypothetical protein